MHLGIARSRIASGASINGYHPFLKVHLLGLMLKTCRGRSVPKEKKAEWIDFLREHKADFNLPFQDDCSTDVVFPLGFVFRSKMWFILLQLLENRAYCIDVGFKIDHQSTAEVLEMIEACKNQSLRDRMTKEVLWTSRRNLILLQAAMQSDLATSRNLGGELLSWIMQRPELFRIVMGFV